jgi:hypothetical protein
MNRESYSALNVLFKKLDSRCKSDAPLKALIKVRISRTHTRPYIQLTNK